MTKSRFARFFDAITFSIAFFLLCYLVLRKYIKSLPLTLVLTSLLCLIFIKIFTYIDLSKYRRLGIVKEELKNIENLNISLRSSSHIKQTMFLKTLFKNLSPKYQNGFIILNNNAAVYNLLYKDNVKKEDLFLVISKRDFLKSKHISEVSIICNEIDKSALEFKVPKLDFEVKFITPEILYSIAKNNNLLVLDEPEKTQNSYKKLIKVPKFVKSQSKYFFRSALVLYLFAFFIPFSRYYIISATVLLTFGLILFIFGSKPMKASKTILLDSIDSK